MATLFSATIKIYDYNECDLYTETHLFSTRKDAEKRMEDYIREVYDEEVFDSVTYDEFKDEYTNNGVFKYLDTYGNIYSCEVEKHLVDVE